MGCVRFFTPSQDCCHEITRTCVDVVLCAFSETFRLGNRVSGWWGWQIISWLARVVSWQKLWMNVWDSECAWLRVKALCVYFFVGTNLNEPPPMWKMGLRAVSNDAALEAWSEYTGDQEFSNSRVRVKSSTTISRDHLWVVNICLELNWVSRVVITLFTQLTTSLNWARLILITIISDFVSKQEPTKTNSRTLTYSYTPACTRIPVCAHWKVRACKVSEPARWRKNFLALYFKIC